MRLWDANYQYASDRKSNLRLKRCFSSFQDNPNSSRMENQYQNIYEDIVLTFAVRLCVKTTWSLWII